MGLSMRILSALLASSALALGGCTSLLGDFTYDANANGSGGSSSSTGGSSGVQGDIVVMPTTGLITTEQGAKATFSIMLKRAPTQNVAIALSSSNVKRDGQPNQRLFHAGKLRRAAARTGHRRGRRPA